MFRTSSKIKTSFPIYHSLPLFNAVPPLGGTNFWTSTIQIHENNRWYPVFLFRLRRTYGKLAVCKTSSQTSTFCMCFVVTERATSCLLIKS